MQREKKKMKKESAVMQSRFLAKFLKKEKKKTPSIANILKAITEIII